MGPGPVIVSQVRFRVRKRADERNRSVRAFCLAEMCKKIVANVCKMPPKLNDQRNTSLFCLQLYMASQAHGTVEVM